MVWQYIVAVNVKVSEDWLAETALATSRIGSVVSLRLLGDSFYITPIQTAAALLCLDVGFKSYHPPLRFTHIAPPTQCSGFDRHDITPLLRSLFSS